MHESSHSLGCKNQTDKGQKVDNRTFHLYSVNKALIINYKKSSIHFTTSYCPLVYLTHVPLKSVPTFPKKSEKSPLVHF